MALKPDRRHVDSTIDYFMNEVASKGGCVVVSTAGSGIAMDQAEQLVTYAANPSGVTPVGILMCDMVNYDLTRQIIDRHKREVQLGGKVEILTKGTVVTDFVYPGHSPTGLDKAYVGHSGYIAASDVATDHVDSTGANRVIGRWRSTADEAGYAKLDVNLPLN